MESLLNKSDALGSDNDIIDTVDEESEDKFLEFIRYLISSSIVFVSLFSIVIVIFLIKRGQKTRNPQQRRPYIGTRARPSLTPQEPTIYVSPANLPPPPKYEAMAPPSYEEVVGIHYPGYQPPVQPITAPINAALSQATTGNSTNNNNQNTGNAPTTVITVSADSRTAVTVATS